MTFEFAVYESTKLYFKVLLIGMRLCEEPKPTGAFSAVSFVH